MKKFGFLISLCGLCGLYLVAVFSPAWAETITFSPSDVKTVMSVNGAPLHDASNQWGLWAVRAMPIVGGSGLYTILGGSTTQTGWGVDAPSWYNWNAPYGTNNAWFWDASGSEANLPANPLYMIMDRPADTFTSYTFTNGVFTGAAPPIIASNPSGGTNVVTPVDDTSLLSFDFTLGAGATWDGIWQFVVDGSKYTLGTAATPGVWVQDFFGGYWTYDYGIASYTLGGNLNGNSGPGYPTPEPATMLLLGSGLIGLAGYGRKKLFKK